MQSFGIVLLLSAILLWPSNSFGQGVCFDDATAGRMVVALEQAKISEQQLTVQAGSNAELQQQVEILKGTVKLYEEQIGIYKNMNDMLNKMADAKDKAFEQQLKAATPTFMDKVKDNFLAGGIGAILAAVAMLLI